MEGSNNSTTFTDNSYSPKTVTAYGDAKISTTKSKFGGSSAVFDGSGDYIMWPKTTNIGSSEFTIEGWVNLNSLGSYQTVFGGTEIGFDIAGSTSITLGYNAIPGGFPATVPTISTGVWYHFAITGGISSGSRMIRTFWNGSLLSNTFSSPTTSNLATNYVIGRNAESVAQHYLNGYVDEVRVTIGRAHYTASFTPPTQPFANADGSASLPSSPSVGDLVYSDSLAYVCTSTSPVTWRRFLQAGNNITP